MAAKNLKHHHDTPSNIFLQEEAALLLSVDRALASSSNSVIIGQNGEIPLRDFLERYLPNTLKVVSGHFITFSGYLSPQIDIMILDSRYPLLSQNTDGSVLVMLHSVVSTVEVKTNLTTRDIGKAWVNVKQITIFSSEVEGQFESESWYLSNNIFACRTRQSLDTIETKFFSTVKPDISGLDTYILRVADKDMPLNTSIGVHLHLEPPFSEEDYDDTNNISGFFPCTIPMFTPLNDFYYRLVQSSYYSIGYRNFSLFDIGAHLTQYMSWSTASWDDSFNP